MIPCMLVNCRNNFNVASEYLSHLKEHHDVPREYRYTCTVGACRQVFSKFYPFKKHIYHHHEHNYTESNITSGDTQPILSQALITNNDLRPLKNNKLLLDHPEENASNTHINVIENSALNFTLSLLAKNNFTRKDVFTVQNEVSTLLSALSDYIATLNVALPDSENEFMFRATLNKMKSLFQTINSDYKLFKYLNSVTGLELPSIVTVVNDKRKISTIQDFNVNLEDNKSYLILMPIAGQIKTFFQCEDVLEQTLNNQARLENSSSIDNFVNGLLWRKIKQKYASDITIPVWIYADEFEINDSQSSHNNRHSVCGIYFNFPSIPAEYAAKLNNILVAGMLKKVDIKDVGINKLIEALVEKFVEIENKGIEIIINGKTVLVKFVLCLLQGDNLGIHSMLLMSNGFNSTFYCRFCRRPKDLLKTDTVEHADCHRRRFDYDEDINVGSYCDTGIVGWSLFNELPSFHVTENKSVDAMHDFFSTGICKYGFVEVLDYCIYTKRFFTLKTLNIRKKEVGAISLDNELTRMPDVTEIFLSKEKRKSVSLKMTSNEMRIFCHHFTLLIGHYVPQHDPIWNYALQLIKLVDFCLKNSFTQESIQQFRDLVAIHHDMYIKVFKKELKPKHHFLVHYPSVIISSGPIRNMMCFRNEAKHKGFKQYAHIITSRKNICYTLCVKSYLQFSNDMLSNIFFKTEVIGQFHLSDIRSRNYFKKIIQPLNIDSDFKLMVSSSVIIKGTHYKTGQFVAEYCFNELVLYEIIEILSLSNCFYLVLQVWNVGSFHEHYLAYETLGSLHLVDVISINFFKRPPFMIHVIDRNTNDTLKGRKMLFRFKNTFSV